MIDVLIRTDGTHYTVAKPFARIRHGKPAIGTRAVHYYADPETAARAALTRLTGQTSEIAPEDPTGTTAHTEDRMQLALLEPNPTPGELRGRKDRWLSSLRSAVRLRYRGERITTDEVWSLMGKVPELRIPDGMSPNVMGFFFAGWSCAERTGEYRRSERERAHANLLTVWLIH